MDLVPDSTYSMHDYFKLFQMITLFGFACKGGREGRDLGAIELAKAAEALGCGEILLNCIDCDGAKQVGRGWQRNGAVWAHWLHLASVVTYHCVSNWRPSYLAL